MNTGERIRQARLAAGLTQTELADKVGLKFSAIHKYESGLVVNLKREKLSALAQALGVKNSVILWPLRVAVSGLQSTPGGATELCAILGKDESLRRIARGIELLQA